MARSDIENKLYFQPPYAAVARAVGYAGKTDAEMRPIVRLLVAAHGKEKVTAALAELTVTESDTNRTVLRSDVRKLCWGLLGPPPEHPRHDEIRYAPPLYTEEERRQWREEFERKKGAQQEEAKSETPKKRGRPRGR
jgi:hypothetical protein